MNCTCGKSPGDHFHSISCAIFQNQANELKKLVKILEENQKRAMTPNTFTTELLGRTENARCIIRTHADGRIEIITETCDKDLLGAER